MRSIFGEQGPWPQLKQVALSESELVYILDSSGRITVLNVDRGPILVLKCVSECWKFSLLLHSQGFIPRDPVD